jgi:hypothetical protein
MRIAEHQVMQLVDGEPPLLVFLDESTGAEAARPFDLETVMHLIDDVTTARIENKPLVVDDVSVAPEAFDKVLTGLGYFTGQAL